MSSIIKCGPSPSKLAFWVDWKMADIISPLPECSKRKNGKSISVEEQQIILNVAKYFQEESKSGNKPQFRAGAVIAKTAAATGVSKNSVRKIVSVGKVIDEGKTRKAKVRFGKLDNFDVGVIRRIIHNLYQENISPSLKKILRQLKENINFPYRRISSLRRNHSQRVSKYSPARRTISCYRNLMNIGLAGLSNRDS